MIVSAIADLQYGEGDRSRLLTANLAELCAGRLAPLVGETFSLASRAHRAIQSPETVAKTLLLSEARCAGRAPTQEGMEVGRRSHRSDS